MAAADRADALPAPNARAETARLGAPALTALALALALLGPLALLLAAPLILGVPHVAGDLRCLMFGAAARERRTPLLPILAPLAAMVGLGAASLLGLGNWPRAQLACGVAAVLGGIAGAPTARWRRSCAAAAVLLLGSVAWAYPAATLLLLAHAHNLIAFAWYFAWARDRRAALAALWIYAAGGALILAGAADFELDAALGGLSARELAAQLAPGASALWAGRLVQSFAFAQAVHYAVWVWLLPSAHGGSWSSDLGRRGAWIVLAGSLLVPALALLEPAQVRGGYLALAAFHGWLEFAVLAFLGLRGARA